MIFLTGGTGLLGLHILDELRSRSLPVTALVRDAAGARVVSDRGARPVTGTVESPETWAALGDCSAIIHGAAIIAGRYPWSRFEQVNVAATRLAAERARQLNVPLIHVSSVAVYGRNYQQGALVDESYPFAPLRETDLYARSKRMAEEVVWEEAGRGLRAVALRPCVVYGQGDRLFLPKLVGSMQKSRWVPLIGGGERPLTLVHARNVAQAVVLALVAPRAWGHSYNLTNDDAITAREFVAAVGRGLGKKIRTVNVPAKPAVLLARTFDFTRRMLGPSRYPGSAVSAVRFWRGGNPYTSDKARSELGWNPAIKHAQGIEDATRVIGSGAKDLAEGPRDSLRSE
jgi:nucleoside-diphosphate-sugar epimerase